MLIANHIKLDRFQVSSHRIHGKICKRGKPFNLQSKPYLRAVSEHISKSQLQRETRQQKKHCKTKYSEGKTKSPKPLTRTAFGFTGIRNSKQKAQAEKKKPRSKPGKMFSQIFVQWNYPISQSFTCKQKWWALRIVLRMNWKIYQVAATVTLYFPAFAVSSMPFFFLFQLSEYIFIENLMFCTKMYLGRKPRPYFART